MTHPQTAALIDLLERVEAGAGHYDVLAAANDWAMSIGKSGLYACVMDAYHGSLDAAKALHDAVLPGWIYDVTNGSAFVIRHCDDDEASNPQFCGECESSARAWLIAIIRALIADTEGRLWQSNRSFR